MSQFAFSRKKVELGNAAGFSLFEMLAVLVILGIMAGTAAPALGRIMDNLKFRQQVGRYREILQYARIVAVSRGEIVSVKLSEEEECLFVLSGPVDETRDCGLDDEDVLTMDPGEIFFYPEGIATPAVLTFETEERVKRIRLDLLTARTAVE